MAADTITQRPALVTQWVTVTDIAGRTRTEMRWISTADAQAVDVRDDVDHAA